MRLLFYDFFQAVYLPPFLDSLKAINRSLLSANTSVENTEKKFL